MIIAFLINISIAFLWTFLIWDFTLLQLILGFLIGLILLTLYSKLARQLDYTRRLWSFLQFTIVFLYAFVKANLEVAALILFVPKSNLRPSTFTYDVSHLSKFEKLLLSHVISLTPGTITVEINNNTSTLLIHCLHFNDPVQTEKEITSQFKEKILRFTR